MTMKSQIVAILFFTLLLVLLVNEVNCIDGPHWNGKRSKVKQSFFFNFHCQNESNHGSNFYLFEHNRTGT